MGDIVKYVGGAAGAAAIGAVTAATAAYFVTRPEPFKPLVDLNRQTIEVPNEPFARMSPLCKDGKLQETYYDGVTTVYEAFKRGARISNNGACLGWRPSATEPYKWLSYNDVLMKAANFGAGLLQKGIKPKNTSNVGMYSTNRVEHWITELACYTYSMVIVPLYDTLGPDACSYIIDQAEIECVVCDKNEKAINLLKLDEHKVRTIIIIEPISDELKDLAASKSSVEILTFQEVEKLGIDNPVEPTPPTPDDLCTICYTSGTTGHPKGAMITHRNLIASVAACTLNLHMGQLDLGVDDIIVSYLPLAHMYERMVEIVGISGGGKIGFFRGDVRSLLDDIQALKPTVFPTVPRLLNRLYDQVLAKANASLVKKALFNYALSSKESEIRRGVIRNDGLWDRIAFKQVRESLGGRVRLITTGSAPLSEKVLSFVRCVAGCAVVEGYGQTESAAIATLGYVGDHVPGHVGPPLACNMIKVVDVPDMNYYARNDEGEICFKGPNVFRGYLKDPVKTAEALDNDGWLHTGDIGKWLPNGTIKIIDRKKNIFKLAQGEYIAPEKIENIYIRSRPVAQVFVTGESLQAFLVAVVVPDKEQLQKWAASKLGIEGDYQSLCLNKKVEKAILDDLIDLGKKGGLKSFEQVKHIHIHTELFTIENGLLTPTFKTKRLEVQKHFKPIIQSLYAKSA